MLWLALGLALSGGQALAQGNANQALAEELLALMNMPQTIEQSLAAMKQAMPAQLAQMSKAMGEELPAEAPQQTQRIMEIMAEELRWEKIEEDYVALYAATFTAEELKGLIAFYQSPAGRAFVAKQPALMQRSMEINQKLMIRVMPRLKEVIKPEGAPPAPPEPEAKKGT
jgi:hypothetical protein